MANARTLNRIASSVKNFFEVDFGRSDSWKSTFNKLPECIKVMSQSSHEELKEPRGDSDSDDTSSIESDKISIKMEAQ